jgi:hypothetical protein
LPNHSQAVQKTEAFKFLQMAYYQHRDICLLDFDGYDYTKFGMSLKDVVHHPSRTMGHAFVLALLLENKLEEVLA